MGRSRTKLTVVSPESRVEPSNEPGWPTGWQFPPPRGGRTGCDDWCKPLHIVEAVVVGKPWAKYFDVDDFMIMSRLVDSGGTITHYKHRDTRRYINVGADGTTYAYDERDWEQASSRFGYSATGRLRASVEALGLWELPWLRSELAADRLGLDFDDRWEHPDAPGRLIVDDEIVPGLLRVATSTSSSSSSST